MRTITRVEFAAERQLRAVVRALPKCAPRKSAQSQISTFALKVVPTLMPRVDATRVRVIGLKTTAIARLAAISRLASPRAVVLALPKFATGKSARIQTSTSALKVVPTLMPRVDATRARVIGLKMTAIARLAAISHLALSPKSTLRPKKLHPNRRCRARRRRAKARLIVSSR